MLWLPCSFVDITQARSEGANLPTFNLDPAVLL